MEQEQRAHDIAVVASWLRHAAEGELFVPTFKRVDPERDVDPNDPLLADLIEASRSGTRL